jgi:hypothetical protein
MSDEEGLSRLLQRGKRKAISARDADQVDALMERMAKFHKGRRATLAAASRPLDARRRQGQHQRGGPTAD